MDDRDFIRRTGSVYTPTGVAAELTKYALSLTDGEALRVLEPSVGDGSFVAAFRGLNHEAGHFSMVDINDAVIKTLREIYGYTLSRDSQFICEDFLSYGLRTDLDAFDMVIGNPPYIRKHNYSIDFKQLVGDVGALTGYDPRDIKNAWVAFVLLAEKLLAHSGVLAFVLPYELMNVSYGQKLLKWMLEKFCKVEIFIPDDKTFKDIDQDAIAIVAQKSDCASSGFYIHRVATLDSIKPYKSKRIQENDTLSFSVDMKSFLFDRDDGEFLQRIRDKVKSLSDYCESAPGIVSAANDFFIVDEKTVEMLGAREISLPILKKGSYVSHGPVFSASDFDALRSTAATYLLNLGQGEDHSSELKTYLKKGEDLGIDRRYKCSRRNPWYRVPVLRSTQGFFFKRCHSHPRMCLNEANVLVTDTAYRLTAKPKASMRGICYSFYNSLTLLFAEIEGRFYGGGVLELSPVEFKSLPLPYHEPTDRQFAKFVKVHEDANGGISAVLDYGDRWLAKKIGLSEAEIKRIRGLWAILREHRLRHGQVSGSSEQKAVI